jgi:mono/diheme cytochrome c family protein
MKGGFIWTSCVLSVAMALGCGGERRSGAVATTDSGQTSAADRAAVGMNDTTSAASDTGRAAAVPDSASTRQDTTSTATQQQPPQKPVSKPRATKPVAPAKAAAPTKPADSSRMSAVPESTSSAPPVQTSDASAPLRDQYHTAPLDTVSQEVYQGWKQFNLNCARCHGEDVQGTTIAPHLIVSLRPEGPINTKEIFVQTVCAGRPAKGMPAWCALGMDMDKINQIYAYVKGRSDSKIHPGRPAVRSGG